MTNQTYDISIDGIAVFDGFFAKSLCKNIIDRFKSFEEIGFAEERQKKHDISKIKASDKVAHLGYGEFLLQPEIRIHSTEFLNIFWECCYKPYQQIFFELENYAQHKIYHMKIQKTSPSQGYHVWHSEHGIREHSNRILVFSLYLNDVEEGGETEFLYQKRRVAAKEGRLALWPAAFTHLHRGNPPLSGDKYILTGWVEL